MTYFIPGLWHFAAALSWAAALGTLGHGDSLFWLRQPAFSLALVLGSSGLFFVPDAWSKKGPLKFFHYPLPDWDVLFLGPASHRNWFTHSPVLPFAAVVLAWRYPHLPATPFAPAAAGLGIGVGSHLFWDCVGSRNHKIIVIPHWISLRAAASRLWLLLNATLCLLVTAHFGVVPGLQNWAGATPAAPQGAPAAPLKPMNTAIKPRLLATGMEFPEGPSLCWNDRLLCVDIPTGRIMEVDKARENAVATEWLNTSEGEIKGNPNGSKFHDGLLYVCDSGRNQMLAIDEKKRIRVLAGSPNGPNDCAFDPNGDFFFTDPNYQQQTASVFWCRRKKTAPGEAGPTYETVEWKSGFHFPNGVAVGPDGAVYIAETQRNRIWRYERRPDGSAGEGAVWFDLPGREDGEFCGPDGMEFDKQGRLYVAHFGLGAVEVIAADGKSLVTRLDTVGANPTNLCFAKDGKTLYVTETVTYAVYALDISGL